ncbi:MAG: T9SS type A sorting domain-containing protein [Saprospiraceae bacterium]|nr:T9SS type A sorting domain-containing protein [Saprospiraceae bacterium]
MNKIHLLLRALPLLALWLLGQPSMAVPSFSEPVAPVAAAEEICELPPPDTVWITGATQNSIKIAWTPVPGAYSYKASVVNLDGGGAPPDQVILAPQTEALFTVTPGKYQFTVKATSCANGSYGEGRTVIGSTAIIIDEIVYEFCTPSAQRMPADFTVCVPYGNAADSKAPVRALAMEGTVGLPGQQQTPWNLDFRLMMPCPGAFAYDIIEDQTSNIIVSGMPVGNGSFYELSFYTQSPFALIFKITSMSWCTSNPAIVCPGNNNNGCGHGFGSCIVDFAPSQMVVVDAVLDNNVGMDSGTKCMGRASNFGWCINNPVMYKTAPGHDHTDPHTFSASDSPDGLLRVAPNPLTFGATITYGLVEDSPVQLTLYDAMGRPVKTLEQSTLTLAGVYNYDLDANDLPPGAYYLVLQTAQERRITTIVKSN